CVGPRRLFYPQNAIPSCMIGSGERCPAMGRPISPRDAWTRNYRPPPAAPPTPDDTFEAPVDQANRTTVTCDLLMLAHVPGRVLVKSGWIVLSVISTSAGDRAPREVRLRACRGQYRARSCARPQGHLEARAGRSRTPAPAGRGFAWGCSRRAASGALV